MAGKDTREIALLDGRLNKSKIKEWLIENKFIKIDDKFTGEVVIHLNMGGITHVSTTNKVWYK